ncbi:hypothetical protein PIB30_117389 [Stylosanthes scabra]|uniref:RNase H type-1 domain-containing protein n=1 Tax=Stylosanthes scabra TaxID=79078 RepID=A0ABU6VCQ5_9FABA|nr:hypothetical protein [Stylosanthes scabra]
MIQALQKQRPSNNCNLRTNWEPPPRGWVKLNTDGAVWDSKNMAGCGGLIRTYDGSWVAGFTAKLGNCQVFQAELWGMRHGLQMAWDLGVRRIIVETDSAEALDKLNSMELTSQSFNSLVREIHSLKNRPWEILFQHIKREGNQCANWLAKNSLRKNYGFNFIDNPHVELQKLICNDCQGRVTH